MFKNYLKTNFRNLWKNKGYTFLNVFGLGIGITCAGLIFLWVKDELTFNDYFDNQENLYKVKNEQTYDGKTFVFDATPGKLAEAMKAEIPGVVNTARGSWGMPKPFTKGDNSLNAVGSFVDPSFLKMFHLHFIEGNPSDALNDLKSVVITQKMANNFFGKESAIGKELRTEKNELFKVTGVIKDLPENTSFDFQWLAPFKNFENENEWLSRWGNNGIITYVETTPGVNIKNMNSKMREFLKSKESGLQSKLFVYPMTRWHLYDQFDNGHEAEGSIKYVRLFSIIAWIILIIACINFMNLSTARSEKRAREVGVRKVLGAGKGSLRFQFLSESMIMAFLASFLAIVLIILALPYFNNLVQKHLSLSVTDVANWMAFISIALICGLLAGSYPSFYLASFNPVAVLKGSKVKEKGAGFIRKGLVVLQFTVSIFLIIATIIIYQQIQHLKDRDLGFSKENLLYMPLQGKMKESFPAIKNELMQTGVVQDAGMGNNAVLNYGSNTGDFSWKGKDPDKQILITISSVDANYIPTVGYELKEGRNFYEDPAADSNHVIINETMARLLKTPDVLGSQIYRSGVDEPQTVVGVVKDFIYNDFQSKPAPIIFFNSPSETGTMVVRIKKDQPLQKAVTEITSAVKRMNPGYPAEVRFIDADFNRVFQTESLIGMLAGLFSVLAIVISCLGLFSLSAFTAERRTREIGIRKVLGATESGLATLLSKEFMELVGISCLIAFPLAWWIMNDWWLTDFEYRISISWKIFVAAGLLAMIIALLTVSFQAIKAAWANPVDSLRTE